MNQLDYIGKCFDDVDNINEQKCNPEFTTAEEPDNRDAELWAVMWGMIDTVKQQFPDAEAVYLTPQIFSDFQAPESINITVVTNDMDYKEERGIAGWVRGYGRTLQEAIDNAKMKYEEVTKDKS